MKTRLILLIFILIVIVTGIVSVILLRNLRSDRLKNEVAAYSGSKSCRPCHERFYELWHDSHHGLAMQPVTGYFIEKNIRSFNQEIKVGTDMFKVLLKNDTLVFEEMKMSGETNEYPAIHTMGGKYIYYFLTPLSSGRLQVLPLAYDCDTDTWYNNPESGVRHFEAMEDAPLDWMNHLYTFNTTCYNCHVSQLETNYDLEDNTYNTTWREPGINCETCHGPSYEHIIECVKAGEGNIPEDLKIVQTSIYTPDQHNAACGSCHAKATVIAESFKPGARFYDYFDLITLENPDFYADGRDLGENYTMTTWEMNKCAESSGMHCVSCHTSSGRYRFGGENANDACMPCHSERVNNVSVHTFHLPDSEGSKCIACHMPKTTFARMDRSDHSFRPPMPRATIAFGSPNACNICHDDMTAECAEKVIQNTHKREYQAETIENGYLIRKARAGDWSVLDEILSGLEEGRFDKVYTTSFIRLLENCDDPSKWDVMLKLTYHGSPLVRGAAAHSLYADNSKQAFERLFELVKDDYRLVRLNAAFSLSSYPDNYIDESNSSIISAALAEYENSLVTNPDDWSAHYNLGNYYSNINDFEKALEAYNTSIRIYPEAIMPMVNAGYINSILGNYNRAEELFTRALSYAPNHEAALLNLALLYGETGNREMAKQYFKRLMAVSDENAVAAYNLAVLHSDDNLGKAVELSRKAMKWEPGNIKYAYTHAFYLVRSDKTASAKKILEDIIDEDSFFFDSYFLLSGIYINEGNLDRAKIILEKALKNENLAADQKQAILSRLEQLEKNEN
ncbi:MAG: tetratricopeptide repeat protein [Bacteroidota bacterium]|nr:tetratricopeptide repeat protein [Bacteroidota bacterium]